jgi:hypothetical protein
VTDEPRAKLLDAARLLDHALRSDLSDEVREKLTQMTAELRDMAIRAERPQRVVYRPMGSVA